VDAAALRAEKKVRDMAFVTIGNALVDVGNLITMIPGFARLPANIAGAITKWQNIAIKVTFKFILKKSVMAKLDIDQLNASLNLNTQQLSAIATNLTQVRALAVQLQRLKDAGASQSRINAVAGKLNRAVARAYDRTLTAKANLSRLLPKARQFRHAAAKQFRLSQADVKQAKNAIVKFKKDKEDRDYDILDAQNKRSAKEYQIKRSRKSLTKLADQLVMLEIQHKEHCPNH